MSVWSAQSIGAVWFVDPTHQTNPADCFLALTGFPASSAQLAQVFAPAPATNGFAQGEQGDSAYVLQFTPGRIAFTTSPTAGRDRFEDTEERIRQVASQVTGHGIDAGTNRLAFLVNLMQAAADLPAANSLMRQQIGTEFPFDCDQDFTLRINRRAHIGGQECNRLYTWAVGLVQNIEITISLPGMPVQAAPATQPSSAQTQAAAFAAIDVNTVPDAAGSTFSPSQQRTVFATLTDEALRLCRENRIGALT